MSVATPAALLLLLLIPIAILAYLFAQRRRSRYAVKFTNLDLLASVVDRSPNVKRHVPALLYLLAIGLLLVGFAGPQVETSVPRNGTVILVEDISGSMTATDVEPSRLAAAQDAARTMLGQLPEGFRVSLISFSNTVQVRVAPTTDREAFSKALDGLNPLGGTAMGDAILTALDVIQQDSQLDQPTVARGATATPTSTPTPVPAGSSSQPNAVIMLISDGASNAGSDPLDAAAKAKEMGIPIFTFALGTSSGVATVRDNLGRVQRVPVPPDPGTLQQIADATGAQFYDAPTAEQLEAAYKGLGEKIGSDTEQKDIGLWFLGAGVVGLVVAGGLSLAWFNRFP